MSEKENTQEATAPSPIYKLAHPVDFGKEQITEIEMKPTGKAMRDFKMRIHSDESIEIEPFRLAELGLTMAGKPRVIAEMMHPEDVTALGIAAMAFIMPGQKIGKDASR